MDGAIDHKVLVFGYVADVDNEAFRVPGRASHFEVSAMETMPMGRCCYILRLRILYSLISNKRVRLDALRSLLLTMSTFEAPASGDTESPISHVHF